MIATLLLWSYILLFSFIYGWTFIELLIRWFRLEREPQSVPFSLAVLTGLVGITVITQTLSLFINLGWLAQLLFLLVGLLLAGRMWKRRAFVRSFSWLTASPWLAALALLIFVIILENGTHGVSNPDTGIYHAQAIRWIESYPAVPGLGNLHSRLAYNSSWLVLNAFFSFAFLGLRSFHVLPGAFLLAAMVYFLEGARGMLDRRMSLAGLFKVLLIPLVFYTVGSQISAPGTDFPADVFAWITLALFLDSLERPPEAGGSIGLEEMLVLAFSFYLVTIKLSAVMFLLLGLLVLIRQFRQNKLQAARLLVLPLVVLLPWMARNLVLSGYWVYPVPLTALFSLRWDWKIPLANVVEESRSILAWARMPRAAPDQVLALRTAQWMEDWFANLSFNRKILVIASVSSPLLLAISAWLRRRNKRFWLYTLAYAIAYAGLLFWLFEAPDIRFGYGVLVSTLLLALVPLVLWVFERPTLQRASVYALLGAIGLYLAVTGLQSFQSRTFLSRILYPTDYPAAPTTPCSIHGIPMVCAQEYGECWYEPFPCIPPGSANPNVEMRGHSLRNGFRHLPNP